ncbi:MAG: glycosyltransferase family 39 protein [Candidatus Eremiobacteraeota bacterium]|nr:glycosyltransferase family 39 protein [Candidatus Eremiobacteraeota bacterium]
MDRFSLRQNVVFAYIAAAIAFIVHAVANPHYGFFRDELYFIICGMHPQFGYVDQPPVAPLLAAATQTFGHSLFALRLVPAFFAAAGIFVTCRLVTDFGGTRYAQGLAAVVVFFTPVLLNFGMKVSPDEVGLWLWTLIALLVVRIVRGADERLWLGVGLCAGVALQSKYSVAFFLAALVAGLLLTPERRILRSRWALFGALLAAVIALPNFLWQAHYGFPMWELLRNGQNGKNVTVGPVLFLLQQLLLTGLFLSMVWIVGLVWLFRAAQYRFLGYTYVILIALMIAFHGKHYYPADVYPIVIAAGAVAIQQLFANIWLRTAIATAAAAVGLIFAPFNLPVLPEATYVKYETAVGNTLHFSRKSVETEHGREESALPGDWADMHGWPEMAAAVKDAYASLPSGERQRTVVFAGNYGEASAVAFFDPGIPVISEHNQYWLWGTRGYDGATILQVGGTCFKSDHLYNNRMLLTRVRTPWAIGYENNLPIWHCSGARKHLADVWPNIKSYE